MQENALLPVSSILLIFYLVLLFKWSAVKRPFFYFIGAIGLLMVFVGAFFIVGPPERPDSPMFTVKNVFDTIGNLLAFVAAFIACYGASLPVDKVKYEKPAEQQQQQKT